jgi:hypothetical protein
MAVAIVIIAVLTLYVGACLAIGMGPVGSLASFRPGFACNERRFSQSPSHVAAAYRAAATSTPGMAVADEAGAPPTLLVDSRPTTRVLDGNFGMAIRFRFESIGEGTLVRTEARSKVWFAFSNHHAALSHVERAVRERAKQRGLEEVLVARW